MGTGKPWNVRELQFLDEGLVQPHSKISLSTQQEKNEDPKMKHSNQSWAERKDGRRQKVHMCIKMLEVSKRLKFSDKTSYTTTVEPSLRIPLK